MEIQSQEGEDLEAPREMGEDGEVEWAAMKGKCVKRELLEDLEDNKNTDKKR